MDFRVKEWEVVGDNQVMLVSGAGPVIAQSAPYHLDTATVLLGKEDWNEVIWGFAVAVETRRDVGARLARLEARVAELCDMMEERPTTYNAHIHALGDSRYLLRQPLLVAIEEYDEEVVASIPEFDLYASGVSDSLALMRLKAEIVSTYERLIELSPDRLGPLALQGLEAMKKVIEPRHG